jgi:hypothetical protein
MPATLVCIDASTSTPASTATPLPARKAMFGLTPVALISASTSSVSPSSS